MLPTFDANTQVDKNANGILFAANVCFISGYGMVVPHLLFIHPNDASSVLHEAVIMAMSLYAGLQISGIWLINNVSERLGRSLVFCAVLRIFGSALLLSTHSASIVAGSVALALGHAIFYKQSRVTASEISSRRGVARRSAFANLQLSTNIAFVIAPTLGAAVLSLRSRLAILFLCTTLLNAAGTLLLASIQKRESAPLHHLRPEYETSEARGARHHALADALRLFLVILAFSAFIALSPIKTQQAGLGPEINAELSALNSTIAIIILILPFRWQELANDLGVLDTVLIVILLVLLASIIAGFTAYVVLLCIWSAVGAIEVPLLEKRIFSNRGRSIGYIDRLLLVDGFGSFAGPFLADMSRHFASHWGVNGFLQR